MIFSFSIALKVDCETLPLCKALKQSDIRIKCDKKINHVLYIFNTRELPVNRKDLGASTLAGLNCETPLL